MTLIFRDPNFSGSNQALKCRMQRYDPNFSCGWSSGGLSHSKTASPSWYSMRDPYHLGMLAMYVWDSCEKGVRVTKMKTSNGLLWSWDKKSERWAGRSVVAQR